MSAEDIAMSPAGLKVSDVSKTFPGTRALSGVSLEVAPGEIHALVGGNGSGKSTLIKVLAGVHEADSGGHVAVGATGRSATDITSEWARESGLRFVHQDLGLFDELTVSENVFVGLPYPRRGALIDWRALHDAAAEVLERLKVDVSPRAVLAGLRPSDRTLVAIGRALRGRDDVRSGVLVLDEPTARLAAPEARRLLDALRRYAGLGQAILYVSHRLDEVLAVADRITVLRDGRVETTRAASELGRADLARLIAGREPSRQASNRPRASARPLLAVRSLAAGPLSDVDLTVASGELVGVAGLVGAGRSSLLRAIYGALPRRAGSVTLDGRELRSGDIADAVRAGVGFVPEDRAAEGAFLGLDVRENLLASNLGGFRRRGWMRRRHELSAAAAAIDAFDIRCPAVGAPLAVLSGGNQQKLLLARWLTSPTRLLLLDEPTHGVDVGGRADIYRHIRDAAGRGVGVLLTSSDPDELLEICDRVLVIADGRIVGEAGGAALDNDWLADQVYGGNYSRRLQ